MDMLKLMKIVEFITLKHDGQIRKGSLEPYVVHPIRVFNLLIEKGITDFNVLAASLLHDTLEDTDTTKEEIIDLSNEFVYYYVCDLTKQKGHDMYTYMSNIKEKMSTRLIKIADRIQNLQDSLKTTVQFRKKYIKETEEHFLDLAKDTIFEEDLKTILNIVKESVKVEFTKDEIINSKIKKEEILINKCLPYLKELNKISNLEKKTLQIQNINDINGQINNDDYKELLNLFRDFDFDKLLSYKKDSVSVSGESIIYKQYT